MHPAITLFPNVIAEGQSIIPPVVFEALPSRGGPVHSTSADIAPFLMSGTSAGLVISDSLTEGVATATSNSTNQLTLQGNGEPFKLATGNVIAFEANVALTDADGMSFFVGLAITDTAPWSTNLTDYVGFFTTNGTINIGCGKNCDNVPGSGTTGETDQAATSSTTAFADATYARLQFYCYDTTLVRFYVNGSFAGLIRSNIPDDEDLTVTLGFVGDGEVVTFRSIACYGRRLL